MFILIVNNLPIKPSILKCEDEEFCLIWNMPLKYIFSLETELAYYYTESLVENIFYHLVRENYLYSVSHILIKRRLARQAV